MLVVGIARLLFHLAIVYTAHIDTRRCAGFETHHIKTYITQIFRQLVRRKLPLWAGVFAVFADNNATLQIRSRAQNHTLCPISNPRMIYNATHRPIFD